MTYLAREEKLWGLLSDSRRDFFTQLAALWRKTPPSQVQAPQAAPLFAVLLTKTTPFKLPLSSRCACMPSLSARVWHRQVVLETLLAKPDC